MIFLSWGQILRVAMTFITLFIWGWGSQWLSEQSPDRFNDSLLVITVLPEIILAQNSLEPINQTNDPLPETATNTTYFISTNTQPTIWDKYYSTTTVHPLRRADVLFFISIPFTLLWTDFWVQRFRDFSSVGAYLEGVRGTYNLQNINFTYYHDTFPASVDDPFYVFKWVNAVLWPLIILSNDFLERISDPVKWEKEKAEMIDNRFHLNLIHLPAH